MTLTMKKMGAAVIAAALALCIAPVVSMLAPSQAHAATKQVDIAKALAITSTEANNYTPTGRISVEVETGKYVKQEVTDGSHWLNTAVYTGKQVKPYKVVVSVYDPDNEYTHSEKRWDSETKKLETYKWTDNEKYLKAVNVTGKSAKDAAKLAKKKKADVTIEYVNNVEIGVAQVIIKGAYNKKYYKNCAYKGTIYRSFTIQPAQVKKVTVKAAKKALKISWKKVKGVDGYYVSVDDKDSGKTMQTVWVDAKKKSVTVKGLPSKRIYEVTVTPYKRNVTSKYKYTNWFYDKYETVTDEEWNETYTRPDYNSKKLIFVSNFTGIDDISGQISFVKEKKTK